MKVKYVGRADAVRVDGVVAERGVPVEVDDAVGSALVESGVWSKHTPPKKPAEGADAEEAQS